ncbi:MAG: hypothetical protein HY545_01920 [Candidatus Doudnabacteria bacterium]|nr:hypothetical protein [Candidatus Doudnabacteria bacterium]
MSWLDNQRTQEWLIVINDNLRAVKKNWLYALGAVVVLAIPLSLGLKALFFELYFGDYAPPGVSKPAVNIEPLQVLEKKVLRIADNSYSGFVRIKNLNLDWGIPEQAYTATFKTLGGTVAATISGKTFILPASEKLVVFSKFTAEQEPQLLDFFLHEAKFLLKPQIQPPELEISRVEVGNAAKELTVNAAVKNNSPFKLRVVYLYAEVLDKNNQVTAVNSTSINDLNSLETRSFQLYWPTAVLGAARAVVKSEVNIFDRDLFSPEPGRSQFETYLSD